MISQASIYDLQKINSLIKDSDLEFSPPLSERVKIDNYVQKVFKQGEIYIYQVEKEIKGILLIYINDSLEYKSYLSLILVKKDFRKNKENIGGKLVLYWIELAKTRNFKLLEFEVASNKKKLISWYESFGFSTISSHNRNNSKCDLMKMKL